jgi:hypothetical protein
MYSEKSHVKFRRRQTTVVVHTLAKNATFLTSLHILNDVCHIFRELLVIEMI